MILIAILIACLLLAAADLVRAAARRPIRHAWAKFALVLAVVITAACGRTVPQRPAPVPAQCDSLCFAPCNTQLPKWTPANPDDPRAWDTLGPQVIKPGQVQLQQCELHRKACDVCIQRLRAAGVLL
ncbi:hypothetical protein [Stenotrophomonas acidaminiphila]|uniref:hypothetical protein n=1 Tax=Stenotrophomonas acidaminiphila TaxID=128780 RepID=UPI0020C6F378|nr:hypothetical protein [Stenotrophomonas acidaminiphila]